VSDYDLQTDCEVVIFPERGGYSFGHEHGRDRGVVVVYPWVLYEVVNLLVLDNLLLPGLVVCPSVVAEAEYPLDLCKEECLFLLGVMESC